jgi:predicted ATPase
VAVSADARIQELVMFLRRLRLSNIRSIAELDMNFETPKGGGRPWTFILGENGAGKSTILRAIALALAGSEALPEVLGDHDWWIREGCADASIDVEIATSKNERRHARLSFTRGSSTLRFLTDNTTSLETLDSALAHASRNYFVVGYGVSRRAPSDNKGPNSITNSSYRANRAQNIATLFSSSATLVSLEQWAIDLDYRRGDSGLAIVRKALDTLLPDVTFNGVDKEHRRLRFKTPDGVLPLELLSDGYQAMAAWCGDLLYRITETFANHKNALSARGLLLIDELDLHLHPVWQRQLVSFLRSTLPNFQFVTTTHSPLTVHQAGEGELFILQRPSDSEPSRLRSFDGAPNKFMVHQLIQSPIFGLETLDSPQTARVRRELRVLKGLPASDRPKVAKSVTIKPGDTAQKRAAQIRSRERELADVPDWRSVPKYLEPTNKLLELIATELAHGKAAAGRDPVKRIADSAATNAERGDRGASEG